MIHIFDSVFQKECNLSKLIIQETVDLHKMALGHYISLM